MSKCTTGGMGTFTRCAAVPTRLHLRTFYLPRLNLCPHETVPTLVPLSTFCLDVTPLGTSGKWDQTGSVLCV